MTTLSGTRWVEYWLKVSMTFLIIWSFSSPSPPSACPEIPALPPFPRGGVECCAWAAGWAFGGNGRKDLALKALNIASTAATTEALYAKADYLTEASADATFPSTLWSLGFRTKIKIELTLASSKTTVGVCLLIGCFFLAAALDYSRIFSTSNLVSPPLNISFEKTSFACINLRSFSTLMSVTSSANTNRDSSTSRFGSCGIMLLTRT